METASIATSLSLEDALTTTTISPQHLEVIARCLIAARFASHVTGWLRVRKTFPAS